MTTLLALEGVLTAENCEEILLLAEWKSKEEAEDLAAARMAPKAAPAPLVRKMPSAPAPAPASVPAPALSLTFASQEAASEPENAVPTPAVPEPAARVESRGAIESTPLGDDRYLFRGVAGRAFREKLRRAQEIESHAVPDGDPIKVLERALDLLIEKHAKRVVGTPRALKVSVKPSAPAPAPASPASCGKGRPHIPIAVERAVRLRDGDCCAFLLADGSRCASRWKTELDHVKAFALGGETTVENLRIVCRSHNALLARRTFGAEVVSRYAKRPAGSSGGTPARGGEALRQTAGPK